MLLNLSDFFQFGPIPANAIKGYFNSNLVILSYLIAVLASYVALDMASRLRAETDPHVKRYWLLGGAFAMGAGIWSMHFIGMLAFVMPRPTTYNMTWTILSMLAAILASGFALFLLRTKGRRLSYMVLGGILLGLGISTMHYMGMEGMSNHTQIHYVPHLFWLSILIAILASEAALWLALQTSNGSFHRQLYLKLISALIMGAAICGMHYTGMAAAVFTPLPYAPETHHGIAPPMLAFFIAGITTLVIGIALALTTYKQLITNLHNKKDFLNAILDNLSDGIIACDAKGKIILTNKSVQKMINQSEFAHLSCTTLMLPLQHNKRAILPQNMPLKLAMEGEYIRDKEYEVILEDSKTNYVMIDGQPIKNEEGEKIGAIIAIHDITDRKLMEQKLLTQATHDSLTGLPNRLLLEDRINQSIKQAKRTSTLTAILFIDFDHFKLINDNLGHSIGDELLKKIALRLQHSVRDIDTIARLGGDEFIINYTSINDVDQAAILAHKILASLQEPLQINNQQIHITPSIGISIYPRDGEDVETLLKHADAAMYRVKAQGRNNIAFYSKEININTKKRLELEQHLHGALGRNEFVLYYQPIIDVKNKRIACLEALIRWQHPTLGLIMPLDFIPLAEELGIIIPIGEWAIQTACAQNKAWQNQGLPHVRIAVNVSSRQFNEIDISSVVRSALETTQLQAKYLELEITESMVLQQPEKVINTLKELQSMGVHIALDDFGTGYSSLGYLSRLPVNKLKIDRSFVQDITNYSEHAAAIVLAILSLASSLKLKVTAEGTENATQLSFLCFNRCDEIQGYYFSKPLTIEACAQLLKENPNYTL